MHFLRGQVRLRGRIQDALEDGRLRVLVSARLVPLRFVFLLQHDPLLPLPEWWRNVLALGAGPRSPGHLNVELAGSFRI